VISMPLTQSADGGQPLITSASPAMLMGISQDQAGDVEPAQVPDSEGDTVGWLLAPAVEGATPETTEDEGNGDGEEADGAGRESNRTQGYWRIG